MSTQPIEYTNRQDKTYYLFQGTTKKGNPRYFFSPSASGGKTECVPLDHIPEGYELFEHPNSNVLLRKKLKTAVLPQELFFVRNMVEELEREDNDSADYKLIEEHSGFMMFNSVALRKRFVWRYRAEVVNDSIIVYEVRGRQASEVLCFVLVNAKSRQYDASRWIDTGMGHWRPLSKTGSIETVASEYCPKLVTDEFYEMF